MSWGAVIGAGAALIGGSMASSSAKKASKQAAASDAAALAFEQQRYDDWKEVYGPIQESLGEFYGSLDSDFIEAQGLESIEQERSRLMERLDVDLAQRGIVDSGIAQSMTQDIEMSTAQQRAKVRTEAPLVAAQQKLGFLQAGLGSDPSSSMSNLLQNQAQSRTKWSQEQSKVAGQAVGNAVQATGTALAKYVQHSAGTGG